MSTKEKIEQTIADYIERRQSTLTRCAEPIRQTSEAAIRTYKSAPRDTHRLKNRDCDKDKRV